MLILASESPRRRELLGTLGIPFEIRSAEVEELEQKIKEIKRYTK